MTLISCAYMRLDTEERGEDAIICLNCGGKCLVLWRLGECPCADEVIE
jgi:hypothetical protein